MRRGFLTVGGLGQTFMLTQGYGGVGKKSHAVWWVEFPGEPTPYSETAGVETSWTEGAGVPTSYSETPGQGVAWNEETAPSTDWAEGHF